MSKYSVLPSHSCQSCANAGGNTQFYCQWVTLTTHNKSTHKSVSFWSHICSRKICSYTFSFLKWFSEWTLDLIWYESLPASVDAYGTAEDWKDANRSRLRVQATYFFFYPSSTEDPSSRLFCAMPLFLPSPSDTLISVWSIFHPIRNLSADPRQTDGQCASRHLLSPVLSLCGQFQRGAGGVSDDEEGLRDGCHRQTGQDR